MSAAVVQILSNVPNENGMAAVYKRAERSRVFWMLELLMVRVFAVRSEGWDTADQGCYCMCCNLLALS